MDSRRGFTILELSIVLTIVALIIGGIVLGQDMIRNAQIKSIGGEYERYTQAIKNFQDKYKALPGDFATAETFWGASNTDNGNGDGRIILQGNSAPETDAHYEQFTAWQQLALAGFIDGKFTGAAGSNGTQDRIPGINVPASKFPGAGWGLVSITAGDISNDADCADDIPYNTGDMIPNHVLWFGGRSLTPYSCNKQALLFTTEEALLIDEKLDDGIPVTGKVVAQVSSDCVDSNAYDVGTDITTASVGLVCTLVFKTGF